MSDLLIRNVPDQVVAAIDARAGRLGLSRSAYLRRRLAQDAGLSGQTVTIEDLSLFADTFADLADEEVMAQAWR